MTHSSSGAAYILKAADVFPLELLYSPPPHFSSAVNELNRKQSQSVKIK